MADINDRLEKQMEGTNLALAAVAEVLQKMDGRLAKEEQEATVAAQETAAEAARDNLVKSVASEVAALLKEGSDQGLDVSGDERKAKGTGGTPQNADDSESAANVATKIEDQQNTIQAMRKADEEEDKDEDIDKTYKGDKDDDEDEIEKDDDDKDEADDIPETEEKGMDDEDDDDSEGMESMKKQLET